MVLFTHFLRGKTPFRCNTSLHFPLKQVLKGGRGYFTKSSPQVFQHNDFFPLMCSNGNRLINSPRSVRAESLSPQHRFDILRDLARDARLTP